MTWTFRRKVFSIVGVAALAFVVILAASAVIAAQVEQRLEAIQQHYLPKVELVPQLEGQLEHAQHGFQDAVAAHDLEALVATANLKDTFLATLDRAANAVDPAEAAELRSAVGDYFASAQDVSRRLIAGEKGEQLLETIGAMQAKLARTAALIKRAGSLDRGDMAAAFAATVHAEATAGAYRLWVSVACMAAVLMLSLWVSRGLLRSVSALNDGFARFGRGDFSQPIEATSRDELGDLARHANEMAASLDSLGEARRKAEDALVLSNRELEAFSYSVAHDLRAPLRGINGFSQALLEDYRGKLDQDAQDHLNRIGAAAERMGQLIDALLGLSRVSRVELKREEVNLTRLADAVAKQLRASAPNRLVDFVNQGDVVAYGDAPLLRALLDNLLGNAWKFTNKAPAARVSFGATVEDGVLVYHVEDNGAGFDMAYAKKLFAPFQRLHSDRDFAGTGIGLATVQRIVHRHGGRIWANSAPGEGAAFHFTLPNTTHASEGAPS